MSFALFLHCLLTSFSWNSLPLSFLIPSLSILIWKHACPQYSVFGLSLFFGLFFTYSFFFNDHFYFLIMSLKCFKVSLVCRWIQIYSPTVIFITSNSNVTFPHVLQITFWICLDRFYLISQIWFIIFLPSLVLLIHIPICIPYPNLGTQGWPLFLSFPSHSIYNQSPTSL